MGPAAEGGRRHPDSLAPALLPTAELRGPMATLRVPFRHSNCGHFRHFRDPGDARYVDATWSAATQAGRSSSPSDPGQEIATRRQRMARTAAVGVWISRSGLLRETRFMSVPTTRSPNSTQGAQRATPEGIGDQP